MDARPKTRQVNRNRETPGPQMPRGAKQIVIPMTEQEYEDIWPDAGRVRSFIEPWAQTAPELFPEGFDQGYSLHGFGRESLKMPGLKLRKIILTNGASYWLRPSFVFSYMTGTVDELSYPLLLATHGVPFWLLTIGFGHNDMFWLKIRDRCRKARELHRQVWDVYRAATVEQFRRRMNELKEWCATQTWTAPVLEMLTKLWNKTEAYAEAYAHPGCHRTSNAVDRPMNRLCRLMYANRGLHGHQASSELRLRGRALLLNFRPYAPRSNQPRPYDSPAHRLNGKRYHEHWLHNLMVSTSLMGFRNPAPAIR